MFYVASVRASQNWYNLKVTFNMDPTKGFKDQPRTIAEAEKGNWTKVDNSTSCDNINNGT